MLVDSKRTGKGYNISELRKRISKLFDNHNVERTNDVEWVITDLCHLVYSESVKSTRQVSEAENTEFQPLNKMKFVFEITDNWDEGRIPLITEPMTLGDLIDNESLDFTSGAGCDWNDINWETAKVRVKLISEQEGNQDELRKYGK